MKKLISAILAVVMLLSAITTVSAASFGDVKKSDWFYDSVNYVSDKGIMQGTGKNVFSPNTTLSRAMAVTLLFRIAGTPSVSGVKLPFGDVKNGQWYTDAVKWAYDKGVVNGKSNTVFGTNDNFTRAEFVTILYRYSTSKNYKLPVSRTDTFADAGEIPEWAFMAAWTLYRAEIINGKSGGFFDANANMSRAEAAAMIERFMKAPKDGKNDDTPDSQPSVDNPDIPTTGNIVVKEKKYDYNGANVMILNVENQTDKNINLTITAKYQDGNGKTIETETRKIEGFPANYRNYVILNPGIKFDKFSYEVKASSFKCEALMKYIVCTSNVEVQARPSIHDVNLKKYPIRAELEMTFHIMNTYTENLTYHVNYVMFDKNGDIFMINTNAWGYTKPKYPEADDGRRFVSITYDDITYDDYTLPEELNGTCSGIVGILDVVTSRY